MSLKNKTIHVKLLPHLFRASELNPSSAGPVHAWEWYLVIIVPADGLPPNSAALSTGSEVNTKVEQLWFINQFIQVSLAIAYDFANH